MNQKAFYFFCLILFGLGSSSCVTNRKKACTDGGQPARANSVAFRGIKKCFQVPDKFGKMLNDGKYFEWYNDDTIALTGQYKLGKKVGRWIEYSEKGEKISDRYYDDQGNEVDPP